MGKKIIFFAILPITSFLLFGCNITQNETTVTSLGTPGTLENQESSYPSGGYPIADLDLAYPSYPVEGEHLRGPDFILNTPLQAGDTMVSGIGPADVPIKLIDLSEIDLVLDETTINEDGSFEFHIQQTLQEGHLIGIILGDISGTSFHQSDFLYNETYFTRPYVGTVFDLEVVD